MASFKSNPVFSTLIAVCLVAAAAEVYLMLPFKLPGSLYTPSKDSIGELSSLLKDSEEFQTVNPTPNSTNRNAIAADLSLATENLASLRAALTGKGGLAEKLRAEPAPTDPSALFFKVGEFRESMLKKYQEATVVEEGLPDRKIKLQRPDEWFGFASYKHSGAVGTDTIAKVFRQMQVANYLLETLLAAQPYEFAFLQRGPPLSKAELDERDRLISEAKDHSQPIPEFTSPLSTGMDASDFFEIDSLVTARAPGSVEASSFRLSFVSKTDALRNLLNKLAAFELPLVVRRVDVEESGVKAAPPPPPEPELDDEGNPMPPPQLDIRVETLLRKFTVTIEYIELVAPAAPAADGAASATTTSTPTR